LQFLKYDLAKKKGHWNLLPAAFAARAPHTGQSSQLVIEANDSDAQFLPTVKRSGLELLS
jgi:hypothetical protein